MRPPAQPVTWQFPLSGGMALPKDREEHPDAFAIPAGSTTLYPVRRGASMHYFSYRMSGDEVKYNLSPRSGSAQNSIQVSTPDTERELIEGLLSHLPGRANAVTLFTRVMALPEHLHNRAIEHIAQQKPTGSYSDAEGLRDALNSMMRTMGPQAIKTLAVGQMVFEISRTSHERRPRLTADYRKRYPEAWIDEAKLKVLGAKPKPIQQTRTVETEFNFGFD